MENFQKFSALCQPWWRFVGVGPSKFIKLAPWVVTTLCIYINIPCKYFTEISVYLQHNVMLYIQKSVSENAGIAVLGVPHQTFCFYHFSTLGIVWSLFVDATPPPHWRILKKCPDPYDVSNPIAVLLYLSRSWVVGRSWCVTNVRKKLSKLNCLYSVYTKLPK
jgi:hypothetical protein